MGKILLLSTLMWTALATQAQSLADSMRPPVWNIYIFVSTKMPRDSVLTLAREAAFTKATLVFKGYPPGPDGLAALQKYIAEINASCCAKQAVQWALYPQLFERYSIKSAPSFVLAYGAGVTSRDFISVSGDMSLANALKFFSQEATNPVFRSTATSVYVKAYSRE